MIRTMRQVLLVAVLLVLPRAAGAQSRVFVGGDLFGDVKRFSGDPTTNTLDGTAIGGGVHLGAYITPHWNLRVALGVEKGTTHSAPIPINVLFPVADIPISSLRSEVTNRIISTSVMLGYQFPLGSRASCGALGGMAFLHVRRAYSTSGPQPLLALVIRPYSLVDYAPAAEGGGEFTVEVTHRLALAAELRTQAFSLNNGPSAFALRSGLVARWLF
jgi:hypothetical protein